MFHMFLICSVNMFSQPNLLSSLLTPFFISCWWLINFYSLCKFIELALELRILILITEFKIFFSKSFRNPYYLSYAVYTFSFPLKDQDFTKIVYISLDAFY